MKRSIEGIVLLATAVAGFAIVAEPDRSTTAPAVLVAPQPPPHAPAARGSDASKPAVARAATARCASDRASVHEPQPTVAAVAPAGMVVGVDPESGELGMPTAEQLAEIARLRAARGETPVRPIVIHHPDGSTSIEVRGGLREYVVVRTDKNGKLVPGCATDRDAIAREAVDATPAPNPSEER